MTLKALIFFIGISISAQTVKYNPFTSQLDLVGSGDVSGGATLTTAGAVPYITGAATLGEMPLVTYKSGTGNLIIGGTTEQNFKFDVASSGSAGTAAFFDKTATTGTTRVWMQAGQGQSTTDLFRVYGYDATLGSGTLLSSINYLGAWVGQGANATILSGFGTSPSIVGTWNAGRVTVGTPNASTTATINFNVTLPSAPSCWASAEGETKVIRPTPSTTQIVFTVATAWTAGTTINWGCFLIKP